MSRHTTRRARTRTASLIIAFAALALMAMGCARTSWSRSSAAGPSIVLHPDLSTTAHTPVASAPEIN